jgi:glycine/D-amino acid oxidase-like deaminating enzyme
VTEPIVVIGGGMIGSAIAFELQNRGGTAVLIDRDIQPVGASAFSFASLTALDEPLRDVYLVKSMGLVGWRSWAKRFGDSIGFTADGEIRWAESQPAADHLRSLIRRAAGRGYPVREISSAALKTRLPASAPKNVLVASLAPEDGQADPLRAIETLRTAFLESRGEILVGRASLLFEEGSMKIRIAEREIEPSRVIIATGAETGAFLERFGWEIPMEPSPGLLVLTEATQPFVKGTVYVSPESGPSIHLRQFPDGRVLLGEQAQDHVAEKPTKEHAERLLRQARAAFPSLSEVGVDRFTIEWRPMPRDGMPIVGPLPGMSSLYVVAAHAGVTLAPALGELVAEEVLDGVSPPRLTPFRPGRFVEHREDADRSIEEAFGIGSELSLE